MSVDSYPVNKQPTRLLRFLGLSGPDAPDRVSPIIAGCTDLLPWWLDANESGINLQANPAAAFIGFTGVLTVPPTSRIIISRFTVNSPILPAAHTVRIGCAVVRDQILYLVGAASGIAVAGEVAAMDGLAGNDRPLILGPGDQVGVWTTTNTGANPLVIQVSLRLTSFQT